MPSLDSHEHGIPLFGHLEREGKSQKGNIYRTSCMITKQLVFISHHPTAVTNQLWCDEPHLRR